MIEIYVDLLLHNLIKEEDIPERFREEVIKMAHLP